MSVRVFEIGGGVYMGIEKRAVRNGKGCTMCDSLGSGRCRKGQLGGY